MTIFICDRELFDIQSIDRDIFFYNVKNRKQPELTPYFLVFWYLFSEKCGEVLYEYKHQSGKWLRKTCCT